MILVCEAGKWRVRIRIELHSFMFFNVCITWKGKWIARSTEGSGGGIQKIVLIDSITGAIVHPSTPAVFSGSFHPRQYLVRCSQLSFSPVDENTLLISDDGSVTIWSIHDDCGTEISHATIWDDYSGLWRSFPLCFSPDGRKLCLTRHICVDEPIFGQAYPYSLPDNVCCFDISSSVAIWRINLHFGSQHTSLIINNSAESVWHDDVIFVASFQEATVVLDANTGDVLRRISVQECPFALFVCDIRKKGQLIDLCIVSQYPRMMTAF